MWEEATHPGSVLPREVEYRFVVVTPVLNGVKYLAETMDSVLSQPGDFFVDYIIKDGGSRDGTIELVRDWLNHVRTGGYPLRSKGIRIALYSSQDNGLYDAISDGFDVRGIVDSDVLTYINADDILSTRAFDICVRLFRKLPGVSWLIGQPCVIDEHGIELSKTDYPLAYNRADIADGMHDGRQLYFIQQEGSFWRASLYKNVGGVGRHLRMAGDYDLWRRFAMHAEPLAVNRSLGYFRKRAGQISSQIDLYYQEVDEILGRTSFQVLQMIKEGKGVSDASYGYFFNPTWHPNNSSCIQRPGAVCMVNELDELEWEFEVMYIKRGWFSY